MQTCPNCGMQLSGNERFCPECDTALTGGRRAPERGGGQYGTTNTGGTTGQQRGQSGERPFPQEGAGHSQRGHTQGRNHGTRGNRQGGPSGDWSGDGYPRPPTRRDTNVMGERIVAQIIDNVIGLVLFFVALFGALFVGAFVAGAAGGGTGDAIAAVGVLIGVVAWAGYFLVLEGLWDGYSLGKRVMGIKVVTDSGESCTVTASVIRNLLDIIDQLPFMYLFGFLFIAMSDNRKRLGDMAAGTVVVTDTPR